MYNCLGSLQDLKQDLLRQFVGLHPENHTANFESLYLELKAKSVKYSQLSQDMKQDFDSLFHTNSEYYRRMMYNAMRVFVFVCINFTVLGVQLFYNSYVLHILDKLAKLVHNMFGCEEEIHAQISDYEQLVFWVLLILQSRLQTSYADLTRELLDLHLLLKQCQPRLHAHMLRLGLKFELELALPLQSLGASFLSAGAFLRLLDQQFLTLNHRFRSYEDCTCPTCSGPSARRPTFWSSAPTRSSRPCCLI